MKYLLLALFLPLTVHAGPYIEFKNTAPFIDERFFNDKMTNDLRLGFRGSNLYLEGGYRELDGKVGLSAEAGYKFKFENWTFKGKWEGYEFDGHNVSHKVETEIRYNF